MDFSLANAFLPAKETDDPDRFAGRKDELSAVAYALASDGAHIVIYGERGVGKSSLARQIERLGKGDNRLLIKAGFKADRKFDFHTIYYTCDDSIKDIRSLLIRLLSDSDFLAKWTPLRTKESQTKNTTKPKFDAKVISLESSKEDSETLTNPIPENDITGYFISTVKSVTRMKRNKDGVLIVIDEFDRIKDRSGLASILKALSAEKVTFLLTGIGNNVQELVRDHESIGRQLAGGVINLPPMSANELNEIFDVAEKFVGNKYVFDWPARLFAVHVSRGHPFYVHLLGKYALLLAARQQVHVITEELMKRAWDDIAQTRAAPIQEDTYRKAIGVSRTREVILKRLASVNRDSFITTEIYPILAAEARISVSSVSKQVRYLCKECLVIEETRDRHYRFTDALFRAYAAARPCIFSGLRVED